jgi:hypothetical protein
MMKHLLTDCRVKLGNDFETTAAFPKDRNRRAATRRSRRYATVIASAAKQSTVHMDCFVVTLLAMTTSSGQGSGT